MYTAQSIDKMIENGRLSVVVEFTDGTDTFTETFYTTSGNDSHWLINRTADKLADLNSLSVYASGLELGEIAARVAVEPTEKSEWQGEVQKLQSMKEAISLGVVNETDQEFIAQQKKVKDTFSKNFMNSL